MQQSVLTCVGLALLSVHLAITAAALLPHFLVCGIGGCRPRERAAWARAKVRRVQRQVMLWLRGREDEDNLGYQIAKHQMRSLCVQRARAGFAMLRGAIGMYVVALIFSEFVFRRGLPGVSTVQCTFILSTYPVMLAVQVWPHLVNERTVDGWYILFSIVQIASDSTISNAEEFGMWGRISALSSLIVAFGCSRTSLVVLINLSMAVCRTMLYAKIFPGRMTSLLNPSVNIVMVELVCSFEIIAISHLLHAQTFVRVYRSVMENALRHEIVAMTRLLDLTCDVVVEMDSGLRISRPSPKLAAMLMLGGNLPGANSQLQDFMPLASDRFHFQTLGAGLLQDDAEALPSAMHATLRGPSNSLLQVEILFAVFSGIDGAKRFLAGIREVTEAPPVPELRSRDPQLHSQGQCELFPRDASSQGPGGRGRKDRRGTPPASPRQPLGGADDELTSTESQNLLMDARFEETSSVAKELSVLGIMTMWNIRIPRGSCCAFHSCLGDVVTTCSTLARRPCFADWQLAGDTQCQACGVVQVFPQGCGDGDDRDALQECEVCFGRAVHRLWAAPPAPSIQSL